MKSGEKKKRRNSAGKYLSFKHFLNFVLEMLIIIMHTRPLDGEQELKSEARVDSSQEIPSTCSEDSRNYSGNGHDILRDGYELHEKTRSGSSGVNNGVGNKDQDHDLDGYEKVNDMEKALKCQAQLIDQYEAMEKAQREWEEKFRENNNSTPVCFIRN